MMSMSGHRDPVIRVLVCSDVRLYRDGLALVLAREPRLEVAGTAADADEAVAVAADVQPDVVLLDMSVPDSVGAIGAFGEAAPETKVLALAVPEREAELVAYADAGVDGYVTRDDSLDDLVAAIESVARGEMLCSPRVAAVLLRRVAVLAGRVSQQQQQTAQLTRRELQIVPLLEEGLSNKEIAVQLHIELPTVKNHVHNILRKLDAHGRADAVTLARLQGMLPPSSPEIQAT